VRARFIKLLVGFTIVSIAVWAAQSADLATLLRKHERSGPAPKILAAYMPWFGDKSHIDVGYSSQDKQVLRRQIDEAVQMGIAGFVVDWNGSRHAYTDQSFALMQQIASEKHFQVALLFNESNDPEGSTDDTIEQFDRANTAYFGPEARYRDSYLTYDGRPVIFIFPKSGRTDWNRVRQHVKGWAKEPILLYKDDSSQYASAFDGFYVWVHPGPKGWKSDGSDWGKEHLQDFYRKMKDKYPDKIAVAGAWPGFDDARAKWGLNRRMGSRCGKTLDETIQMGQEFSGPNPVPFLIIETWNDYEEGTAVERSPMNDCKN
jgi:hypothetical protein